MNNFKKIFICCTEQSGENIAFNILKRINYKHQFVIDGVGGSKSKKYFRNQYFDISEFKSMGFIEILFSVFKYLRIINFLSKEIVKNKYDLIITIDSPDFNYLLVKKIRKNNFNHKIIHIVAPSVWAWRKGRAKKFANIYDELFTLFKFENEYFNKFGLKTTFMGHPIYHTTISNKDISKKYIAFLPGSREVEVKQLFYFYELAYKILFNNNKNNFEILIPTLPHLESFLLLKTNHWKIKTTITTDTNKIDEYFNEVFVSLTCSGTASLEMAKRMIPQLIIYKFNFITSIIGNLLVRVKFANIINIIANEMIIPELTNFNLSKKRFENEFELLIKNTKRNDIQIKKINKFINYFQDNKSPYDICVNRINNFL